MLLSTLFLFIEQPKTIIFIILILVLFFGAKRIPEMMRGIGQGVREFKDAASDANKPPQTSQPYQPGQPQQPYGQPYAADQPYGQQPAGQYPQQPYAAQPVQQPYAPQQPGQPHYAPQQPQAAPVPPTVYDANGQPLS